MLRALIGLFHIIVIDWKFISNLKPTRLFSCSLAFWKRLSFPIILGKLHLQLYSLLILFNYPFRTINIYNETECHKNRPIVAFIDYTYGSFNLFSY